RATVVEEGDWTWCSFIIGFEIGDVKHAGFRSLALVVLVLILRDVVPILRMDDESAGERVVIDEIPSDGDGAFACLLFWLEFLRLCSFGFARRCLVFRLRVNNFRWQCED